MPALSAHQVTEALVRRVIENLVIECTSNTQVVIKQDSMVGADDGLRIMTVAGDLTVDITVSGKSGLDVGSGAINTWYYIWMIMNIDTAEVAGLFSVSATSPTMPSGFTVKRLVSAVRNNGSSNFRSFIQRDKFVQGVERLWLLNGGHSATWVTLDPSALAPTGICENLHLTLIPWNNGNDDHYIYLYPGELSGGVTPIGIRLGLSNYSVGAYHALNSVMFGFSIGGKISYRGNTSVGESNISVIGYTLML